MATAPSAPAAPPPEKFAWSARPRIFVFALAVLSVAIMFWSIGSGAMPITWAEIWEGLKHGFGREGNREDALIWSIRLPRVLLGFLAGGALGMCGAALQGLFRNPLADPGRRRQRPR